VKEWESAKWQDLINRIHSEFHAVIIQFGINRSDGSSDYKDLTGVKSVAGLLKGEELVARVVVCDLIVSIDSGPVHIAGAMGVPAIGLFRTLNPGFVLPKESPVLGLFADVPCLFCHNRTPVMHWITGCPNDIACMKNLDVETVFQSVKSMLARSKRQQVTDC
jgi:ADP-heptose:LPS heptosyltransferase